MGLMIYRHFIWEQYESFVELDKIEELTLEQEKYADGQPDWFVVIVLWSGAKIYLKPFQTKADAERELFECRRKMRK